MPANTIPIYKKIIHTQLIHQMNKNQSMKPTTTRKSLIIAIAVAAVLLLGGIGYYLFSSDSKNGRPYGVPEDAVLRMNDFYYDPVEDTQAYKDVIEEVTNEAYAEYAKDQMETDKKEGFIEDDDSLKYVKATQLLKEGKGKEAGQLYERFGSCHEIWDIEQKLLKEKHGIDWRTPAEINPHIKFD